MPTTTIPVERDSEAEPPYEHCCFCDKSTTFWTVLKDRTPGQQVACCKGCAETHEPKDVPTKRAWCDAEEKRHPSLVRRY